MVFHFLHDGSCFSPILRFFHIFMMSQHFSHVFPRVFMFFHNCSRCFKIFLTIFHHLNLKSRFRLRISTRQKKQTQKATHLTSNLLYTFLKAVRACRDKHASCHKHICSRGWSYRLFCLRLEGPTNPTAFFQVKPLKNHENEI